MKPIKNTLIFLYLFMTVTAVGQNNPIQPDLIPPSPQAAQFIRYGEIPVGYTTGVPQIDVPIYTLKTGWIDIPISISYHASGFRVSDIPSPVGLGWVLNGGGWFISRQIEVRPDFDGNAYTGITSKEQVDSLKVGTKRYNYTPGNYWFDFSKYGDWSRWDDCFFQNKGFTPLLFDTRSDRYFYSFPGGENGVARYNIDTKELTSIPYSPIKIERVSLDFYRITDTKGIKYEYTQKEIISVPEKGQITSAWYLTKIIYPGLESYPIVFSYKTGKTYTDWQINKFFFIVDARNISPCGSLTPTGMPNSELSEPQTSSTYTSYSSPLIENITWKNVTINFTYSDDREDQRKDRLTAVTVTYNNSTVKKATLDNKDYFGNAATNKRLKLKNITLTGNNSASQGEQYTFNYFYETSPAPNYYYGSGIRTICSEDYWGYYNGTNSLYNFPNDVDWKNAVGIYANDVSVFQPLGSWNNAVLNGQFSTNRKPNEDSMKYFVLKEIVYPTKGKSVFEYEMNKVLGAYQFNSTQEAGGLRLKKRINYAADNTVADTKFYEYEGYATQTIMNNYYAYRTLAVISYGCLDLGGAGIYFTVEYPIYFFGGDSYSSLTDWTGSNVFYTKVKEYNGEKINNNGWTEYNYKEESRQLNGECSFNIDDYLPNMISKISDCEKGYIKSLLTSSFFYNKDGDTVKKVENQYKNFSISPIHTGVRVGQNTVYPANFQRILDISLSPQDDYRNYYLDRIYSINTYAFRDVSLISSATETDYVGGKAATSKVTSYDYDVRDGKPVLLTPSSVTTQTSTGENRVKKTAFPYSDNYKNTAPYNTMITNNMLDYPIEVKTEKGSDNQFVNQTLTSYKQVSGMIVPGVFSTRYIVSAALEPRIVYNDYDSNGNPLYISKDNADKVVYLWSYNYLYPVAEIKNATYSDVCKATGNGVEATGKTLLETIAAKADPATTDLTPVNNLRTQLPNALVTTYTYKPLVGIQTMTDPRGVVTKYDYDSFGRLIKVTQADRVIESYEYHYKN